MNYFLTDDQKMIKDLAAQIAREKIAPIAAELDESGEFPWDVVKILAQSDLFRVFIPTEYDGLGGGMFEMCLVVEELSRACSGIALAFAASGLGTIPIILFGSEEQKKKYLPQTRRGRDPGRLRAHRGRGRERRGSHQDHRDAGRRLLRPQRHQAVDHQRRRGDIYTVVALTDPLRGARGASTIIVEKGTPGFTFGKKENKMGIRASATRELVFQDCRVPKSNLLGKEGHGIPRRDEDPRPVAARRRRPGARHRAGRAGPGRQVLPGAPASSASRSPPSRACSSCWPTWPPQVEAARALIYAAGRAASTPARQGRVAHFPPWRRCSPPTWP